MKQKYYVVWQGKETGIFDTWEACSQQVSGFPNAVYKSFPTLEAARAAFQSLSSDGQKESNKGTVKYHLGDFPVNPPDDRHDTVLPLPSDVTADAWAVDAACSGNPGPMEYRGIDLATGAEVFHFGPMVGTNNIGEFLAIVHALALFHKKGIQKTIYSDSRTALSWVRQKKCKTQLAQTAKTAQLFSIVARAEYWLQTHEVKVPLLKWNTEAWGEIPADFGRKTRF